MNIDPKISILEILIFKIKPDIIRSKIFYVFQLYYKAMFTRITIIKENVQVKQVEMSN